MGKGASAPPASAGDPLAQALASAAPPAQLPRVLQPLPKVAQVPASAQWWNQPGLAAHITPARSPSLAELQARMPLPPQKTQAEKAEEARSAQANFDYLSGLSG